MESQELWSDGLSINSATVARADTQQQCCPIRECHYGWTGRGNLRAYGHPGGNHGDSLQPGYFQQTHGPLLHGKRVPPDILVWAVARWLKGWGSSLASGCSRSIRIPGWRGWSTSLSML